MAGATGREAWEFQKRRPWVFQMLIGWTSFFGLEQFEIAADTADPMGGGASVRLNRKGDMPPWPE
jgi:hypothetical protein